MGSEVILYSYGMVCLSMLVFNLIYSLHLRAGDRWMRRRVEKIAGKVRPQLQRAEAGATLKERHAAAMRRCLSRVNNLLAFDRFLDEQGETQASGAYLRQLQPIFLELASVYQRREETQAAYFCYFLTRHQLQRYLDTEQLESVVGGYMKKDSLYCRVNALKALCSFGSAEGVLEALRNLRGHGVPLHEKIIVETLLTFTGDANRLIGQVWQDLEQFTVPIQRALLDFIRFKSGDYCENMLGILLDDSKDRELRFSAIRYFGRYPYPPARQPLLAAVTDLNPLNWEFAAISAASLARYPGDDVVEALSQAMHSGNWYVRYNAAASLAAHGLSYEKLVDVVAGDDRYAREMMVYRLESRRLAEENEGVTAGV